MSTRLDEIDAIMALPEFDLKNFCILDLECKVLRKYYIELASVLFVNNISKYFQTEFLIDHIEAERISDCYAHKDKSIAFLNIVHGKMKAGDAQIFRRTLDTLHFYGNPAVRAVVTKMKCKLFEMRVNKRAVIERRMNNRIAGKEDTYYGPDDYPINNIPDFFQYRVILRCILKVRTTMSAIYKRMDIRIVREACVKNARTPNGPWLTKQLINAVLLVESSEELLEILMDSHHLDWINFSILETLVENTDSDLAKKVMENYKKYTLQLNFLTIFTINSQVAGINEVSSEYTRIKEILAVDVGKMTVRKLLHHRSFLERNVFDINEGSTRVASVDHQGGTVVWIIPTECSFHAYRSAISNLHKFDTIVSLEIENYPIIKKSVEFSIGPPLTMEASSVELIDRYGSVLLEQLNATSLATIMHSRRLLSDEDFRTINSAAMEYQKNSYILARVQNMDNCGLLQFVDILQSLDHQQHIGMQLINELFNTEPTGDDNSEVKLSGSSTAEGSNSSSDITLGQKRPASQGELPCTKRVKVLTVSRKFLAVVREIADSMESVKVATLLTWLASVNVCDDPRIPLFAPEIFSVLTSSRDCYVLVNRLNFYWSWIDYGLLEDVVRVSGSKEASKLLDRFKSELANLQFSSSITLPSPCSKMVPADGQPHTILSLTIDCKLFECTLRSLSELKSKFSNSCGLTCHALLLVAAKQVSVTTTIFYWIILKQIVPMICTKVLANLSKFRSEGILEVSVYPNLMMATDSEMRLGPLAYLTINDGIFNDNVKTLMSRVKELPELVAKLQHEVDPCAIQEDGSRVTKDDDEPALLPDPELSMEVTTADQEKAPDPEPIDEDDYDVEEDITAIKSRARDTHLIDMWLKNRSHYCLQLEKHVSKECLIKMFSNNWELREAGLKQFTQEVMFLLMPEFTSRYRSRARNWRLPRYPEIRQILECSCAVLAYSCTDKAIGVYQAALRLCWMIMYNALSISQEELDELREFFKPVLSVIISRYEDSELSIRHVTRKFLLHFFHSQTGALFTFNNPFGAFRISGLYFVFSSLLTVPVHRKFSNKWWAVRLNFISDTFCKYDDYYFPQEDVPMPEYYNGKRAPTRWKEHEIPVPYEDTLKLLTLIWRFASVASNIKDRDLMHKASQIYRNTIQIFSKYSRGLQRAREILPRCDRSVQQEIREVIANFQTRIDRHGDDRTPKELFKPVPTPRYTLSFSEMPPEEDHMWGLWGSRELDNDKVVALTNYHAMIDSYVYPPIFLPIPVDDLLVNVQGNRRNGVIYRERLEWYKLQVVNEVNNLHCALDVRTGTIMTVTQTSLDGPNIASDKEKLLKEVSLSVGLDHPNIVRYLGAVLEEETFSIFQEWAAGGTLQHLLSKTKGLHPSVVASYTKQLIRGVTYLHINQIIHRNLCDVTIFVDHNGQRLKVSDLSYAVKVIGDEATKQLEFSDDYKSYNIFCTAPEVLRRESYGMSSDAWSVGCCIILISTGQLPWALNKLEDPYIDVARIAAATSPPFISPTNVPTEVSDLVVRLLDIKPEDRLKLINIPEDHHLFRLNSFVC